MLQTTALYPEHSGWPLFSKKWEPFFKGLPKASCMGCIPWTRAFKDQKTCCMISFQVSGAVDAFGKHAMRNLAPSGEKLVMRGPNDQHTKESFTAYSTPSPWSHTGMHICFPISTPSTRVSLQPRVFGPFHPTPELFHFLKWEHFMEIFQCSQLCKHDVGQKKAGHDFLLFQGFGIQASYLQLHSLALVCTHLSQTCTSCHC